MHVVRNNKIEETDDPNASDYEILSPNHLWSTNINMIPAQNAVQGARLFYGARFFNQAMPVEGGEEPLVQTLVDGDKEGRTWEQMMGRHLGAVHADEDSEVMEVQGNRIKLKTAAGPKEITLVRNTPSNRKSGTDQTALVKAGDKLAKGQILAKSNYTDHQGHMAMGLNARVALVPYKGWTIDDAMAISEDFARRLKSDHMETMDQDYDDEVKGGFDHFTSLFPKQFTKDQLSKIDPATGAARAGAMLEKGDPVFLATKPRTFSSASASLGGLSRTQRMSRSNASQTWDADVPGEVTDVAQTKTGYKAVIRSLHPTEPGDKLTVRSGNKGTTALVIPNAHMPRSLDGKPFDAIFNQLGLGSRTNAALPVEMWMGKVAAKRGAPMKLPSFNAPGTDWMELTRQELAKEGLSSEEEIYDPQLDRKLDQPVSTGNMYIMKLSHTASSKGSARGQAGYSADQQPLRGGGEGAQAKKVSGLEENCLLSSGAYGTMREGATLRGTSNDEWWRTWRQGGQPKVPGKPFVWGKFMAMLQGAGMNPADRGKGVLRLGPMTDRHVDALSPIEVRNPGMVDLRTMEPEAGGLFDASLMGANRWGVIKLPRPLPNPAYHDTIRQLLGLKKTELDAILAGEMDLPEHLR